MKQRGIITTISAHIDAKNSAIRDLEQENDALRALVVDWEQFADKLPRSSVGARWGQFTTLKQRTAELLGEEDTPA